MPISVLCKGMLTLYSECKEAGKHDKVRPNQNLFKGQWTCYWNMKTKIDWAYEEYNQ